MRSLGPRHSTLVHLAGGVLVASLLVACSSAGEVATDPAPEPAASPSSPSSPSLPASPAATSPGSVETGEDSAVASEEVAILSATAAGGQVSTGPAVALSDQAAVQSFGAQFETPELTSRISRVVARTDVPADHTLYGAVVAIGCDVPPGVVVTSSDDGVLIVARPAKASTVQCFAPVTSVALVLVTD